jgi:hypothetical protein
LPTADAPRQTIGRGIGLAVFAADAVSSTAYATQEILVILAAAGTVAFGFVFPIALAIVVLLAIVTLSYEHTIYAYPGGGGAYIVARDNLGELPAQTAGAALLTDYILTIYRIRRIVARNDDPSRRMLHETFGLQVISSASWDAQQIEELFYEAPVTTVFSAGNGEVEVYELNVPHSWNGRQLQELLAAEECIALAITRSGRASLPSRESLLRAGDVVHLSATAEGIDALRQRLEPDLSTFSESDLHIGDRDLAVDLPEEV